MSLCISFFSSLPDMNYLLPKALRGPHFSASLATVWVDLDVIPLAVVPEQVVEADHEGDDHEHQEGGELGDVLVVGGAIGLGHKETKRTVCFLLPDPPSLKPRPTLVKTPDPRLSKTV